MNRLFFCGCSQSFAFSPVVVSRLLLAIRATPRSGFLRPFFLHEKYFNVDRAGSFFLVISPPPRLLRACAALTPLPLLSLNTSEDSRITLPASPFISRIAFRGWCLLVGLSRSLLIFSECQLWRTALHSTARFSKAPLSFFLGYKRRLYGSPLLPPLMSAILRCPVRDRQFLFLPVALPESSGRPFLLYLPRLSRLPRWSKGSSFFLTQHDESPVCASWLKSLSRHFSPDSWSACALGNRMFLHPRSLTYGAVLVTPKMICAALAPPLSRLFPLDPGKRGPPQCAVFAE